MSRYVDIDPVLRESYRQMNNQVTVELLEELPIVNVKEMVHGEWLEDIAYYDENGCPCIVARCSNCGEAYPTYNYCPNCGAKMDLR